MKNMGSETLDIYLLRHGQSVANLQGLVCGQRDFPLSELGQAQSKKICQQLGAINFDSVYTSPLKRAKSTIEPLCLNNIEIIPALKEVDTGDYSDITISELYETNDRYKYQGLFPDLRYPNGESLNMMLSRMASWFEQEIARWEIGQNVLISGHEGTLCAVMHNLFKMNIEHYPTFKIANCSYIKLSINSDRQIRVQLFNLDA